MLFLAPSSSKKFASQKDVKKGFCTAFAFVFVFVFCFCLLLLSFAFVFCFCLLLWSFAFVFCFCFCLQPSKKILSNKIYAVHQNLGCGSKKE